jgi:hypothetical protein
VIFLDKKRIEEFGLRVFGIINCGFECKMQQACALKVKLSGPKVDTHFSLDMELAVLVQDE